MWERANLTEAKHWSASSDAYSTFGPIFSSCVGYSIFTQFGIVRIPAVSSRISSDDLLSTYTMLNAISDDGFAKDLASA